MKILLWSIGKPHDKDLKAAIEQFTQRCNNYFQVEWQIISPPKNAGLMSEADLKRKEGETILQLLEKSDYLVALDERGKQLSSEGLAGFIGSRANESTRRLIFLIGGAYGIDEAVLKAAQLKWSLSSLTFPHQLVRLILAEQLYRAFSIMRNEKYHHA
jgi:23S rRNA (pseudouridine1915-N3)-methyltransferase